MKQMKVLALAFIPGLLFILACSRGAPTLAPKAGAISETSPQVQSEGKVSFEKNCAPCHGVSGEGTALAPKIAGHSMGATKMQVRYPMGMMPAFSRTQLNDADLDKIASYVNSFSPPTAPANVWERAAPETIHYWMALIAIKNNDMANARQHMDDALTFVKEPKHKAGMEKAISMMGQGNMHDAEYEIEEMAGMETPSGITMQRFHLQLVAIAIEAKNFAELKRHTEHFIAKATDSQKKIARELLEKAGKGDFHGAEHEMEELIKG